jgi:hypothetical protein
MDMKQVNIPKCIWKSSRIHFNPTDLLYNFLEPKRVKKAQGNEER